MNPPKTILVATDFSAAAEVAFDYAIALAGALGSDDRMVRFATAANLSDSPVGRDILRRTAMSGDGSDAARMAAEVLWTTDDPALVGVRPDGLRIVAS